MTYIVSYTIHHNDDSEVRDFYLRFDDDEYPCGNALDYASSYYDLVLSECPSEIDEDWHLLYASISIIIKTNYNEDKTRMVQ